MECDMGDHCKNRWNDGTVADSRILVDRLLFAKLCLLSLDMDWALQKVVRAILAFFFNHLNIIEEETTSQTPLIDLEAIWQTLTDQAILFGPQILFAILILVVGNWVARLLSNLTRRTLENRKVEP